ncbi:MAG: phosphatidylglycerophosphatase A [Candidatus Omnitrophica bacterium]|nr:phosphatidylglycerophosphatase A [Candidatus Omnitrophota bacterium]
MNLKTEKLTKLIVTFFYLGYVPYMPGTFGSLAGVIIFLCLGKSSLAVILATIIITLLGFVFCGLAEKVFSQKDPSCIVIDEVSGMLLCYCFVKISLFNVIAGFVLFRLFDIIKPFQIKRLEKIKGSAGIMLDDLAAAGYAIIFLKVINHLIKLFG